MSRSQSLKPLLRTLPPPLRAQRQADETGVSLRSAYRVIEALRAMGVIDGAAGCGYTLVDDPALPPMRVSQDETEALMPGLRELQAVADPVLARAAQGALSKLPASLPASQRHQPEHASLHAKRFHHRPEIYPLGIVFFENALVLTSRCLLQQDFRSFRVDRIGSFTETGQSLRPERVPLLRRFLCKSATG